MCSIVACSGGVMRVLNTERDDTLGGTVFDRRLADHVADEFKRKHRLDVRSSARSMAKLVDACEHLKKTLTTAPTANFSVDSLHEGVDLNETMNRAKFESICSPLFRQAADVLLRALAVRVCDCA